VENVALSASAAARRPSARAAAASAVQQSIDIYYPPGTQQQTRRTLGQTDERMDTVPLHKPCSAYCDGSANKALPYNSI